MNEYRLLPRDTNQAQGVAQYALDFLAGRTGAPSPAALAKTELFHLDSVACAVAALATGMNAPRLLREEALGYPAASPQAGAGVFGSNAWVQPEKAVAANSSAVRELDSNGTNFGYNPRTGYTRGEFGHNDFYPVALAAAQQRGWNGGQTLRAMLCLDEIRGRLAECFGLKDHKIDHVVHGAIASAAVYAAALGGTVEQVESAIGLVVAHSIPFRAIRHGAQLSDSKGASAAISAEAAVLAARRALRGFVGPADIFRNPQAIFCLFEKPPAPRTSPFDLELATAGDDFAIQGMHFKLGLYEHQSAGAIAGLFELLAAQPEIAADEEQIEAIEIAIYEPAFSIIGDPHKRDPRTRQSADHSMPYIIATLLRKALARGPQPAAASQLWEELMLVPADYDDAALFHPVTRRLMQRLEFAHGGPEYDARYPDGIPTSLAIRLTSGAVHASGLVMYPLGHARNTSSAAPQLLERKFHALAGLGVADTGLLWRRMTNLAKKSAAEIRELYDFPLQVGS